MFVFFRLETKTHRCGAVYEYGDACTDACICFTLAPDICYQILDSKQYMHLLLTALKNYSNHKFVLASNSANCLLFFPEGIIKQISFIRTLALLLVIIFAIAHKVCFQILPVDQTPTPTRLLNKIDQVFESQTDNPFEQDFKKVNQQTENEQACSRFSLLPVRLTFYVTR